MRKPRPNGVVAFLLALILLLTALLLAEEGQTDISQSVSMQMDSARVYLHVSAETSYGWFWQKSTGRAYTTRDAAGKQRVKVDRMRLTMIAHDTTTQCVEQADSIVVSEKKRGIAIPRRTVKLSATSEGPTLGPETMEIRP